MTAAASVEATGRDEPIEPTGAANSSTCWCLLAAARQPSVTWSGWWACWWLGRMCPRPGWRRARRSPPSAGGCRPRPSVRRSSNGAGGQARSEALEWFKPKLEGFGTMFPNPPPLPTGVTRGPAGEPLPLQRWRRMARGSGPRAAPVGCESEMLPPSSSPGLSR